MQTEEQVSQFRNYVYHDEDTDTMPFAIVFFMFRAGAHQAALDFLERAPASSPAKSLAPLYRAFFKTHGRTLPQGDIAQFLRDCEGAFRQSPARHDLYLDALVHLMVGSNFKPASE